MNEIDTTDLPKAKAKAAHDIWAHWMKYMFTRCEPYGAGCMLIPANLVERWQRQMNTAYEDLTESEQRSDRNVGEQYLYGIDTLPVHAKVEDAIDMLNAAYQTDPAAIFAVLHNPVPCMLEFGDHPHIVVAEPEALPRRPHKWYALSGLGVLNSVLSVLGLQRIAGLWSKDETGVEKLKGFCVYNPPEEGEADET